MTTDQQRRPAFFWLVLLICVVYAGFLAFTIYAVVRYYGVEKAPGWSATRNDGTGWFVSEVDTGGPAAGRIQVGDRLLAINGDQRRAVIGSFQWVFVDGGKTYRVDLDRGGERVSVELPMSSSLASDSRPSLRWSAWLSSSVARPWRSCGRTILRSGWPAHS